MGQVTRQSDMKARIIGVQTKMQTFSVIYELQLAILVLAHSDSLSTSIQRVELCAVDAQQNAKLSVTVLRGIQSDRDASLHWTKVINAQPEHHSNVEDFYHQVYFETVGTVAIVALKSVSIKSITPCLQSVSRFL